MREIIYKMTDDLINNFYREDINIYETNLNIIDNLSDEDKIKLNVSNIKDEIEEEYNRLLDLQDNNIKTIDDLMHFYYPDLVSYEILYDNFVPTGEIKVCLE